MEVEPPQGDEEGSSLKWHVRLPGRHSRVVVGIAIAAVAAGLLGTFMFHSPFMSLLGFAMILASTADYWLGSKYLMDSKGVRSTVGMSVTFMEWKDVKRVIVEPSAIKLSPLDSGSRLDAFRGVTMRTTPILRSQILGLVKRYAPENIEFLETERESPR